MQNNKGWDFLTTFADINDNYIYQASKPWKENKIKTFKMSLKKVIACAVIVMIVGLGLTHQNEVKAAWEKMTSLIGQILGISEDTGEYIKQIQNKITKNGVKVSLEEVAVDDENLWIAYSMTDENGNNDVSMSSIEASVDGVKLELERQYSNYNNTDSKSKDYVARFSLKASSAKQNFEITIGNFNTKGDQLYIKDKYNFSFTADPKILERDTKEVFIDQFIQLDEKQTVTISKAKYNLFSCTLYGILPDMSENTELWIRGKDDVGNEISFNLISYRNPELIFELAEPGSARNAKKLTLQLYQYTENEESNILYKKEDYGDFYAEKIGKEYEENQSPEELAVPVGNEFTVDLQN